MFLVLSFLRLFFSFKVTRAFGPFTMLLKLSSLSLAIWIVLTFVIVLVTGTSSVFCSTRAARAPACSRALDWYSKEESESGLFRMWMATGQPTYRWLGL